MRKYVNFCIVLLITVFFTGCGNRENVTEFMQSLRLDNRKEARAADSDSIILSTEENADGMDITVTESTEVSLEKLVDMEEIKRTILENAASEFTAEYPINEAFLDWFSEEYNEEALQTIAQEVKKGSTDANFWYDLTGNSIHVLWLSYCKDAGFKYQLENVKWKTTASKEEITMAFTGDINFSEGYVTTRYLDACENGIYDCFSADLLELMQSMDIMMLNNEFTYSTRGTALEGKAYTFRADPSRVELLETFGTDIVSLANNHVYDFGPDALLDTVSTLEQAGIPAIGAGKNLNEASEPYYFVCNGRKIAIVAATQIERSLNYTKEATEDSPGVLKTLKPEKFVKVIEKAEKKSDYVIAFVHWGTEGDSNYGNDQVKLAEAFVEAGADAIIGGHTHCLQGFDIMNGVPIIYSLGNFWFSKSTQDTGLAKVTIDTKGELSLEFIPCIQKNLCTYLVTEADQKKRILDFMQKHSALGVLVTQDGKVEKTEEKQ
ncbi:MAG: CapA family protein [Lachnospiraceae bacterium]|nr:CapA family protein [Lachnospiraceae bacterium]